MKKLRIYGIYVLLLVLLSLSSCSKGSYSDSDSSSGNPVSLSVSVSGIKNGESNASSTRSGASASQTVTMPLGKGVLMEATLTPKAVFAGASTRSSNSTTTPLSTGVTYRVIAFKQGNVSSSGYVSYGDFTVGGSTTSSNFIVPAYGLYTFVCYSLNSTAALPTFSRSSLDQTLAPASNDLLYYKFDKYISSAASSQILSIVFNHIFSNVTLVADASKSGKNTTAITSTFSPSYNATLSLSGGTLSTSGSSSAYTVPWGTITPGQTVSSTPFNVFTNGEPVSVAVPSVTIGGTTYTHRTATFSSILPGVDYTITLSFITGIVVGGVTWAPGNLLYSDGTYSFASQEYYSGLWNGGDYFCWDTLDPTATSSTNTSISWNATTDPCTKVSPTGTWRTPTNNELTALINSGHVWGSKNGVSGTYFGTSTVPTTNVDSYVFLPAAGVRGMNATSTGYMGVDGDYWSSTSDYVSHGDVLDSNSTYCGTTTNMGNDGNNVRCVLSQ
jgi:hypothetical protein